MDSDELGNDTVPVGEVPEPTPPPDEGVVVEAESPATADISTGGGGTPEVPPEVPTEQTFPPPVSDPFKENALNFRQLLIKARNVIQANKRNKLERVMGMFGTKQKIWDMDVEKFLHVSSETAIRYLSTLQKEGRIKHVGNMKGGWYEKI